MTDFIRAILLWVLIWFLPVTLLSIGFYFLVTIPARRDERARLALEILASGLASGHSPEQTMVAVSRTREKAVGARFHLVAAYIEQGCRLSVAVDQVPNFVPAGVAGLLQVGEATQDYPRCIQAAREIVAAPITRTATAIHYAFALLCVLVPTAFLVLPWWQLWIWPRFVQIYADMATGPMPGYSRIISENLGWLAAIYGLTAGLFLAGFALYLAAPRIAPTQSWVGRMIDKASYAFSWRRMRLKRDFSLCLTMLLEKEFPEREAVLMAAKGTGNRRMMGKAARAVDLLEQGSPLSEALQVFDGTGEFQWRMANALRSPGFLASLHGWHEALDAEAWRREETAAHALSAGILIANGVFVGLFITGVFWVLVTLIHQEALW